MFGLTFRFPAGRYHATPWGRSVNEADVAWPPEPWRILRALVASYWRKGDQETWDEDDLARLIDTLAESLPVFRLPEGAVHHHTRHYMPIRKGRSETRTLIFDAFLHMPTGASVEVLWQNVSLEDNLLALVQDLAAGMGYLGRSESWTECHVLTDIRCEPNCGPTESGFEGEACRVLVPRSPTSYRLERRRLIDQETRRVQSASRKPFTERALRTKVDRSFRSRFGIDTLPERLIDALSLDTADLQNRKWNQPPAAYEAVYSRAAETSPGVANRSRGRSRFRGRTLEEIPTVARFLLAGRPRPRIEDAIKIGEVVRAAAMSKFGWETDERTGKRYPLAPWKVSGRIRDGKPLRDPRHPHAFWLPEDADDDGWIDHVTVFIASGIDNEIESKLDRITRIWLAPRGVSEKRAKRARVGEWRLALEGFGRPGDFSESSRLLATSRKWRSTTPFLASGHLKKSGYRGEVLRLLKRRGFETEGVTVNELTEVPVGGTRRRVLEFHRFRSRGRESQYDTSGALLEIEFPQDVQGPLSLGYASHFGLGIFGSVRE